MVRFGSSSSTTSFARKNKINPLKSCEHILCTHFFTLIFNYERGKNAKRNVSFGRNLLAYIQQSSTSSFQITQGAGNSIRQPPGPPSEPISAELGSYCLFATSTSTALSKLLPTWLAIQSKKETSSSQDIIASLFFNVPPPIHCSHKYELFQYFQYIYYPITDAQY